MALTVSVLMPTYNRANLIAESINSALRQTRAPLEVIVIDDGSSDETGSVVSQFGEPVHYTRQTNAGKSAALNRGLEMARGDCVLVLDDDDILPDDALEAHLSTLERTPLAAISYGRFKRFRGPADRASESEDLEHIPDSHDRRFVVGLMEQCFLPNPAWMVRRDRQLEAGFYRTDLPRGQDYEMILRLARDATAVPANAVTLYQRKHVSERKSGAGTVKAEDTVSGWIEAERQIFAEIDDNWSDREFAPWPDLGQDEVSLRLCVLQRGVIMFLRKLYDRAEIHLERYSQLLGEGPATERELLVASTLLGSRYGVPEIIDGSANIQWLRRIKMPADLRSAFAQQLPWRLRQLTMEGRLRDATTLFSQGSRALGLDAVARGIGQRFKRKTTAVIPRSEGDQRTH